VPLRHAHLFQEQPVPELPGAARISAGAAKLVPLDPAPEPDTWVAAGEKTLQKCCGNRETPAGCNWLLASDDPHALCIACRLNRTIPNLDDPDNARYWALIELAKRRLVSELLALGLPVKSKVDEDPERGLAFDFLRSPAEGPRVLTGHAQGLITINVEEADDSTREKIRFEMREPYRTLLGHFRHEVGHYYWDRLVVDTPWLERFRGLFGDELARSMGQHDFYPFVMSKPVVAKLQFVHLVVEDARSARRAGTADAAPEQEPRKAGAA
jgi:hypothetical protein